ncbi:protein kinase family protein [Streptomyces sp. NPDC047028]|uniref:protein kinase family protein n=1 Tax=Streptomyces sp. NPDC047028 TaxID=3155793 RepID=UPI0033EC1464
MTAERFAAHARIAASLARLDDRELAARLAEAEPLGTGIGGRSVRLTVDDRPVFVKRVPLTDLERRPGNERSTANLFGLPPYCHYGIGSPGYTAWRELAAHTLTTGHLLNGGFPGFPLLHHWRVLPEEPQPLHGELADVERAVAYWGPKSRARIEGLRSASASLALFLEYVPHSLGDRFGAELHSDRADAACLRVARGLTALTDALHALGLLHLDAHFDNILTDGRALYLTDFGLALGSGFRLDDAEREFFGRHRDYDRVYTANHLVIRLAAELYGYGREERDEHVRAWACGVRPEGVPPAAADLLTRLAPLAVIMGDFSRRLVHDSRLTPYPEQELRGAYNSSMLSA